MEITSWRRPRLELRPAIRDRLKRRLRACELAVLVKIKAVDVDGLPRMVERHIASPDRADIWIEASHFDMNRNQLVAVAVLVIEIDPDIPPARLNAPDRGCFRVGFVLNLGAILKRDDRSRITKRVAVQI